MQGLVARAFDVVAGGRLACAADVSRESYKW